MPTLIIDRIELPSTPQSGTYLMWFKAKVGSRTAVFHIRNKEYEGVQAEEHLNLALPGVNLNDVCTWRVRLDDDEDDVATNDAEDTVKRKFRVSKAGSDTWSPDGWSITLHWHLAE